MTPHTGTKRICVSLPFGSLLSHEDWPLHRHKAPGGGGGEIIEDSLSHKSHRQSDTAYKNK